jgi:hypothetical protein
LTASYTASEKKLILGQPQGGVSILLHVVSAFHFTTPKGDQSHIAGDGDMMMMIKEEEEKIEDEEEPTKRGRKEKPCRESEIK